MIITKLKLVKKGTKGMTISHARTIAKDGYDYIASTKGDELRYPIHVGLRNAISELRVHALELGGYFRGSSDKGVVDYLIQDCSIEEITFGETFKIGFKMKSFGEKSNFIETCPIEAKDGYSGYDEVQEILERIAEETIAYMGGKVVVTNKQMALMWDEANGGANSESLNNMDEEELKEFCTKTLTKMGSIVAHVEEEEEEETDVFENVKEFEHATKESTFSKAV